MVPSRFADELGSSSVPATSSNLPVERTAGKLRVLWADDEIRPTDPEVLLLELEGFAVDCVDGGAAAVALARRQAYDAILLDLRLGDESGLDVLHALQTAHVCAPTVVLTGFADVETAVAAMKLGACDFRMKPFDVEAVAPLLRTLAARRLQPRGETERLSELEWLQIQCDRLSNCTTKQDLMLLMLRTIVDRTVGLRSFFGCAEALRIVATANGETPMGIAREMRAAILRAARSDAPTHPKVREALSRLERDGAKQGQLLFADRVGLSRTYLSRLIAAQTGRHASEWCRGATLRAALPKVLQTSEPISQIAYAVGYEHVAQFDRDFSTMFGVCPTELRRTESMRYARSVPRPLTVYERAFTEHVE